MAYGQPEGTGQILGRYKVKSIDFDFVGKRTYKQKRLRKMLSFKVSDSVSDVQAGYGREDLEKFYRKKGFTFVDVRLDDNKLPEGRVIYTIVEGPRVKVKSVTFNGNNALKNRVLKKAIKTTKKKWFFLPRCYKEEELPEDVKRLEDTYWDRGFLDYTITSEREFTADKRKVRITFTIEEGPVYSVAKIVFKFFDAEDRLKLTGSEYFSEEDLRARLTLEPGQIYRERKAKSDCDQLLMLYREHGFVDATVGSHFDIIREDTTVGQEGEPVSKGRGNVEFEIFEGRQFRIGRIDIIGNKQTQDKVVRRILDEYDFQPGQWYNADIARGDGTGELEREIRRTVLAEEATITDLPSDEGEDRNVDVYIKEAQTGMWMLSAGVSSDMGVMGGLMLEQRNFDIKDWPENFREFITGQAFKGAGQTLRITMQPGTELSQHSVSFSEPYLRDKPISLDVTGLSNEWEREGYDEGRLKGYVGFGERYQKRYRDRWYRSIGFRVEDVDADDVDYDAPREIKDLEGGTALVGVRLGASKNLTDDRFYPSKGYHIDSSYEQVFGDYTFGILSGTYRQYSTIYKDLAERKTILAMRVHAATALGDAPAFEKFYAGGMRSIRGFDYRGVSTRGRPEINGVPVVGRIKEDPIGSDWIFLANAQVAVPLVGENLAALFFVDSGAIDSGNYRAAVGTGIQIMIPRWFGPVPMRFEIAAPVMKDDADDTQAFSFSVGRLF